MDLGFRECGCDYPKWKALSQDKIWLQELVRCYSWRAFTPLNNLVNLLESQYYFQETLVFYGSHVQQISTLVPNVLFFVSTQPMRPNCGYGKRRKIVVLTKASCE